MTYKYLDCIDCIVKDIWCDLCHLTLKSFKEKEYGSFTEFVDENKTNKGN